jgi:hypothetical protein
MNNSQAYGKFRLQEAIRQYECEYYASLPQSEEPLCYSKRYRKKMQALCKKSRFYPTFTRPMPRARKCAAVVLLSALILATGLFSVGATRNAVTEWFVKVYESFTEIFSIRSNTAAAPDSIETVYAPTVLPDNYTLCDEYFAQSETKLTWENASGEHIFFIQATLHSKATVDNEETEHDTLNIDGTKCYLVKKKGKICIYWSTKEYAFSLVVPETVSAEQYSAIIASVGKRNERNASSMEK